MIQHMALLNYLKLKKSPLPDPEGPLRAAPMLVPNTSKEQTKRFHRGYIGGSRVSAERPSLYVILQTAKLFQQNEFHLVTAKVFPLESFAVYGSLQGTFTTMIGFVTWPPYKR